jgi:flagellar hook protein FlgE
MSFQQGLSGLNAAAKNLDVIGNNIANSSTVGFKGSSAQFADVFANTSAGSSTTAVGIGTSVGKIAQAFTQGNVEVTSNPLDVAISGNGFFRMSNGGAVSYTRNGQFALDKNGYIVNATGMNLTGFPAAAGGTGVTTAAPVNLQISSADLAPKASTAATLQVGLVPGITFPTVSPFTPTDTNTFTDSTSIAVYDSLGAQHTLGVYFARTAAVAPSGGNWDVYGALDGNALSTPLMGSMAFDSNGAMPVPPSISLNMPIPNGAANIAMTLKLDGSTQFNSKFAPQPPIQDGYATGQLNGYAIGKDGIITASYSNGQTRPQGQIALSTFINPQGLQTLGSNQWAETAASGQPATGAPGSGSLGVLQSGATESSNIDMTAELVNLITAQRVYQANAQTIKTQDSVLQTLVNMR